MDGKDVRQVPIMDVAASAILINVAKDLRAASYAEVFDPRSIVYPQPDILPQSEMVQLLFVDRQD